MHFLKIAKTNIEHAKNFKVYLYLRYRRKRQFMQTILTYILSIICSKDHPHSIWIKPRTQSFWHETMTNHWGEKDWIKNMRMSYDAFTYIDHIFQKKTLYFVNVYQLKLNLLQHWIILMTQVITGRLLTCLGEADQQCAQLYTQFVNR